MAQYIEKGAVLAKIDKFMYDANLEADIASTGECFDEKIAEEKYQLCKQIKEKIDTIEVKEVDLEKEYKDFVEKDPVYNKLVNGVVGKAIAKHFFELGLKAQKG